MFAGLWVPTYTFLLAAAGDLIGYDPSSGMAGVLRNVYLALFQIGSPFPTNNTILSALTEATYSGYARQEIVWFPAAVNPLGPVELLGANQQYRPTDSLSMNAISILGIVTALTGGSLLLAAALGTSINLSTPLTVLNAAPDVQLSNGLNYGGVYASA